VSVRTEKDFYLDSFRGRTLVLSATRGDLASAVARRQLAEVARELVAHGARLVLVLAGADAAAKNGAQPIVEWLGLLPARGSARLQRIDATAWRPDDPQRALSDIWRVLRRRPLCVVLDEAPGLSAAHAISATLRAHKLVVLDRRGGLAAPRGKPFSYLDETTVGVLLGAGEAEFQGMSDRRELLAVVADVLASGVASVNLCAVRDLSRELFTYEGAGTLFTHGDYCRVDRLSIDDFHAVERLVERGQREGLLKRRTTGEIAELLLTGYGAWIGGHHLAGVGALRTLPYAASRGGEIAGLYTITRFKGEGIGDRLVRRILDDARVAALKFVFAVTTAPRAAEFFRREGFREVSAEKVPAAKWKGYDPARRSRAIVFRLDL
jgi:amino-acid N-acetyltransferase